MESLDGEKIKAELNKCTSQSEYESKKADYIRKANEISSGLQARTGYSSSMFGICIIWSDYAMSPFVENKMQDCRKQLENLRSQIGGEKYQHVEELRLLKLQEKKIRDKISELKKDASKEKDPTKKARILLLIEEEGKKLEDNLRQQKAIPTSGIKFDPKQHVDGLIDSIRKALQGKDRNSGGRGGSNRPNKPNKPGDDSGGNGGDSSGGLPDDNTDPNRPPRQRKEKAEKDNSQMILIALAVIVILFLMTNQPQPQRDEELEYYY